MAEGATVFALDDGSFDGLTVRGEGSTSAFNTVDRGLLYYDRQPCTTEFSRHDPRLPRR